MRLQLRPKDYIHKADVVEMHGGQPFDLRDLFDPLLDIIPRARRKGTEKTVITDIRVKIEATLPQPVDGIPIRILTALRGVAHIHHPMPGMNSNADLVP